MIIMGEEKLHTAVMTKDGITLTCLCPCYPGDLIRVKLKNV